MSYIDDARQALDDELDSRDAACDPALVDLYTLLVLTTGELTDLEDVHEAWGVYTARRRPGHRSLIAFDDLAPDVQKLDTPFRDAIRAAADRVSPDEPGPETRVQVFMRFEHPDVDLGPERALRPDLVLGRGPSGRHLDIAAAVPRLLREAADELEAHHLPADQPTEGDA